MGKKKAGKTTNGNGNGPARQKAVDTSIREIPLKWVDDGVVPQSVGHMMVQFEGGDYHLRFFELQLPTGPPEELAKIVEEAGGMTLKCVSHIVVNSTRMPAFIQSIHSSLQRNSPPAVQVDDKQSK